MNESNHARIAFEGPLIAFVGDDFTGSTDAMEFLEKAGLRTALFVGLPTEAQLRALLDHSENRVDAIGIAAATRALPTERMEAVLRPIFRQLHALGLPLVHHKICSTFDSSPTVGSIGKVLDLGREIFPGRPIPLLVAAPILGRYTVFGHLFARSGLGSRPYRLDRHPTMSKHPITPMGESDLRVHLAAQTDGKIELLDILQVASPWEEIQSAYQRLTEAQPDAILIDLLLEEQLENIGRLLWEQTGNHDPLLVIGSSGVEMALGAAWPHMGLAPGTATFAEMAQVEPLLVLSGSCSPVTRDQIQWALTKGFQEVAFDTLRWPDSPSSHELESEVAQEAVEQLKQGHSVILHTALGPEDPRLLATQKRLAELEDFGGETTKLVDRSSQLGAALGRMGRQILSEVPLRRVAVTGGDTSGQVASKLNIQRLEMLAPMAPGCPFCRAHAASGPADGLEFVFKGGQVGNVNFIERVVTGKP